MKLGYNFCKNSVWEVMWDILSSVYIIHFSLCYTNPQSCKFINHSRENIFGNKFLDSDYLPKLFSDTI